MVKIEVVNGGAGSGNISPPLNSPSSCSSGPSALPHSFPYPPQEAAVGFPGLVSWPIQFYPLYPYPYYSGFGYGYGYPPFGYPQMLAYDLNAQPQPWFYQPPLVPGHGGNINITDTGRVSGFGSGRQERGLEKGTTTLMIRNIPSKLRRDELMNLVDDHCRKQNKPFSNLPPNHQSTYDFLYLPIDFVKKGNLGYAFVNFTTARAAFKFYKCFNGKGWMNFYQCPKICAITRADIQGKEASKRHLERCTFYCCTEEYLPVEFSPPRNGYNGAQVKMTTFGIRVTKRGMIGK